MQSNHEGKSNVAPVGYHLIANTNMVYITTHKNSKKLWNLSNKKIISSVQMTHECRYAIFKLTVCKY